MMPVSARMQGWSVCAPVDYVVLLLDGYTGDAGPVTASRLGVTVPS